MLILTRKRGESVIIADGLITVKVLKRWQNEIVLGFEAPLYIPIVRNEIYRKKQRQQAEEYLRNALNVQCCDEKETSLSTHEEKNK